MGDYSIAIVPKVKEYPNRIEKSKEILQWLISEDIVKPEQTDSILGQGLGYSVSEGAKKVVENPEELPFELWTNGLEIILEDHYFHSGQLEFDDDIEEVDESMLTNPESNLGFIFWNWPELKNEFVEEFRKKLNCEIEIVLCKI